MEAWQLSAELEELERALAARPLPGPSARLREKVLGDVRRCALPERRRSRWRFAVTVAAAALLWLNLSLAATRATDFGLRRSFPGGSIEAACRQLKRLVPELSAEELRRQAILLRAGSTLVPCPDLSPSDVVANRSCLLSLDERRKERSN